MDDAVNIWDDVPDWGGIGARRLARLGGGLGASIWEIHPGGDYWRHFHQASDELLVVLRGRPAVDTPDGRRDLDEGDVLPLPHGPQGDRAITNDTSEVVRVLIVSTNTDPDVAEYPDSGKVGVWIGDDARFFRVADAVEHAGPE
ncbi:MAG: cupin domain-containing protein [Gaiellaceae bacterium]